MSPPITAPQVILDLVVRFDEHRDTYRRDYNETQVRRDFLDPFFEALGWDVNNRQGYAEAYREVIHEDALRVEKTVKAPDYCFRVGGTRKFFVEAKKPSVDIARDASPAFQLRRYAWTAKLPLSILTDFEELAVYDCRVKPDKTDKASTARVLLLKYTDYATRWHEIAEIFSREAILRGSFDKYAESNRRKRGTAEVDDAFLEEIETWRESLARNISLRNPHISERELNDSVQKIIDRVIFLRLCEGRGIEHYGQLQALVNGTNVYPRLVELFRKADDKYNSGLFHFSPEKGREPPDELTTELAIDDKVLKEIFVRLYYPESPYEFAALPSDILGQVYEQFLGKVIRLTTGHRAKVEEKPEVRKAGGVYYTPTYIVDYIVANTVGKLLEGKTPQQVGGLTETWKPAKNGRPLSVLDPACGSGSFLIVAYQFLLDWYFKQYTESSDPASHARGANPRLYHDQRGEWRLTTAERKRILLSHIYGVDIDGQAVEVTKLSLLLKVLEGETEESLAQQRRLFHNERALPDLANNIKCGNSLIGSDFYQNQQLSLLDEDERLRINVFDWDGKDGFREIMQSGGFDAVIGNPPYGAELSAEMRSHFARWDCGSTDTAALFVEHAIKILSPSGKVGFIIPKPFTYASNWRKLQSIVLPRLATLIDCSKVWREVKLEQCIIVCEAGERKKYRGGYRQEQEIVENGSHDKLLVDELQFLPSAVATEEIQLALQLIRRSVSLERYSSNRRGAMVQSKVATAGKYRVIGGKQIQRWTISRESKGRITAADVTDDKGFISTNSVLAQNIVAHIQNPRPHIKIIAALPTSADVEQCVILDTVNQLECADETMARVVCATLNSRFINWFAYRFLFANAIRTMHFDAVTTKRLPMPATISTKTKDRMASLVQHLLDLNARLGQVKTSHEKTVLQRQIDATDRQIDQLVYQLYELTDDEIRLVEEATQ